MGWQNHLHSGAGVRKLTPATVDGPGEGDLTYLFSAFPQQHINPLRVHSPSVNPLRLSATQAINTFATPFAANQTTMHASIALLGMLLLAGHAAAQLANDTGIAAQSANDTGEVVRPTEGSGQPQPQQQPASRGPLHAQRSLRSCVTAGLRISPCRREGGTTGS